jgi:hypothetical protein
MDVAMAAAAVVSRIFFSLKVSSTFFLLPPIILAP